MNLIKKNPLILLSLLFFMASVSSVWAGHEVDNGTDDRGLADRAAWFLGDDRSIRVCYEVSSNFGPNDIFYERTIREAFDVWFAYIVAKKVNGEPGKELNLPLQIQMMPACDGSEDLKFYFGGNNPEIERYRAQHEGPLAFAAKTTYDIRKRWGKGFIWVTPSKSIRPTDGYPNWSNPRNFKAILLHEIGHVLGCEHMKGTIMSSNLSAFIEGRNEGIDSPIDLAGIDGERELVLCHDCSLDLAGRLGSISPYYSNLPPEAVFNQLMGRDPVGKIRAKLRGLIFQDLKLIVSDELDSAELPVHIETNPMLAYYFQGSAAMFKRFGEIQSGDQVRWESSWNTEGGGVFP